MASQSDSAGAGGGGGDGGRATAELLVTQFLLKVVHAILAVRSPRPHTPPPPPLAESAFRRWDRWFHLPLHAPPPPPAIDHLPEPFPGEPLVVDVYLAPSSGGGAEKEVLERWTVACEPWAWPAAGEGLAVNRAYKGCITLLRSLYTALRFLPAYRAFRTLRACASASGHQVYNYEMGHRVGSLATATPFSGAEEAAMRTNRLAPVETQLGRLVVTVQYLPSLAAFNFKVTSLESAVIITDYVGSQAAEPMRGSGSASAFWYRLRQRQEIGSSVSSSRSGTIASSGLSSANASSGGSRFSTFSMEAAMHLDYFAHSLGIHGDVNGNNMDDWEQVDHQEVAEDVQETDEERSMDRITSLVQEFFSVPSSANCSRSSSIKAGDMSVVERWLKELGVGWVLSLQDDDAGVAAAAGEDHSPRTWTRALCEIVQSFCVRMSPDRASSVHVHVHLPSVCEQQGQHVAERCIPDKYHLILFIQETMLKMLAYVDAKVARDPDTIPYIPVERVMYSKLVNLLGVHDALSKASNRILVRQFDSPTSVEVDRIENGMVSLLSAYERKLGEAIRSTMHRIRTMLMENGDGNDSPRPLHPQGSPDIHRVTRSVMAYIDFLNDSSLLVNAVIIQEVHHVPAYYTESIEPVDSMIVEMMSSLQEKLVNISESFSDQGLRFLFLLNNSYHIQRQRFHLLCFRGPVSLAGDLSHRIKGYMERYLQASWALPLSCLSDPTPHCMGKNYSPLSKFEFEFQKIYTTQKEWKVPDPRLRRELRKAITNNIIPGYTEYIDDNNVVNPKIRPYELEAMLDELFEG